MKLSNIILTDGGIDGFEFAGDRIVVRVRDYMETSYSIEVEGVTAIKVEGAIIGYRVERCNLEKRGDLNVLEFFDEDGCSLVVDFSLNGQVKVIPNER